MNIPGYVSRALYEKALAASLAANERALMAEARLEQERARFDTLLKEFTRLRVAGATTEPLPESRPALVPEKPDPLMLLIDEIAGRNLQKRAMMLRQLAQDRREKVDDDEIERRILAGIQSEGVPA